MRRTHVFPLLAGWAGARYTNFANWRLAVRAAPPDNIDTWRNNHV
ncbi:MAG TPA: hypothetical protein VNL35_02760 [Chloroflexota bacterium]|nr:hypothetical protein [Chloroflexota bacterium]